MLHTQSTKKKNKSPTTEGSTGIGFESTPQQQPQGRLGSFQSALTTRWMLNVTDVFVRDTFRSAGYTVGDNRDNTYTVNNGKFKYTLDGNTNQITTQDSRKESLEEMLERYIEIAEKAEEEGKEQRVNGKLKVVLYGSDDNKKALTEIIKNNEKFNRTFSISANTVDQQQASRQATHENIVRPMPMLRQGNRT